MLELGKLTREIERRAKSALEKVQWVLEGFANPLLYIPFRIAGGCLDGEEPNDYDVFPTVPITKPSFVPAYIKVIETRNADTYIRDGVAVQVCHYIKPTLKELIESFDFAHIQVGVEFKGVSSDLTSGPVVKEVYYTQDFVESQAMGKTWFIGSEYPMSSMIRALKYAERGLIGSRAGQVETMIRILEAVAKRGFRDYDDFKDQMDAVDLGLVESEIAGIRGSLETICGKLGGGWPEDARDPRDYDD